MNSLLCLQVNRVLCRWERFKAHVLGGSQDALDLYLLMTQLYHNFDGRPLGHLEASPLEDPTGDNEYQEDLIHQEQST